MPISGNAPMITENSQPTAIMLTEAPSLSRRFRCMAYVMVYQRSPVMIISVNTDSMHEKTVRKPATWQPIPVDTTKTPSRSAACPAVYNGSGDRREERVHVVNQRFPNCVFCSRPRKTTLRPCFNQSSDHYVISRQHFLLLFSIRYF